MSEFSVTSDAFAAESAPVAAVTATQAATAQVPEALSSEKMMTDNLLILGVLFFIFYFILIRPQQKRVKTHQEMMKSLQKGQKVLTSGGLICTIAKFEGEDVIVVEVAQGVKVRIARSSVSEVMDGKATAGESANDN